jgi:hypothetical protein
MGMRRLSLWLAALAMAATPVVGAVAAVHTGGPAHVLADDGVISSRN